MYTLRTGWTLFTQFGFAQDVGITVFRVVGGFLLAAIVAVPIGIAMGAFKPVEAFLEPFVSFARYLPASAFIPLLILWAGIGELQKLLIIFIGSVFQIILMITVTVGNTRRDLVEAVVQRRLEITIGVGAVGQREEPPGEDSEPGEGQGNAGCSVEDRNDHVRTPSPDRQMGGKRAGASVNHDGARLGRGPKRGKFRRARPSGA